jgi:hypothetical protein
MRMNQLVPCLLNVTACKVVLKVYDSGVMSLRENFVGRFLPSRFCVCVCV